MVVEKSFRIVNIDFFQNIIFFLYYLVDYQKILRIIIFQCHSVLFLWRKQSDQNAKNGQNDFFFKFLLKIRNLHQKLDKLTHF